MEIKLKIEDSYVTAFLAMLKKIKYVQVEEIRPSPNQKDVQPSTSELSDFQKFLLTAPVMSDEDYQFFIEKRQEFNKWKQLS